MQEPPAADAPPRPLWRSLAWFAGLAAAAGAGTAAVAYGLRALLFSA